MGKYVFKTTKKVEKYIDKIVECLIDEFGISHTEALGRVNQKWSNIKKFDRKNDMIFHMLPEEWAFDIYYGNSSVWWKKKKSELTPLPYIPDIEK